jgi:RNA polymerase sigma factor (sigma-70 family)
MANPQATVLLRHLRKLATAENTGRICDGQLLQRFTLDGDDDAFAALIQRHGPMVLGVCRRVLHHQQDAEDAFQATFFVLARRAGAIRHQECLSSWLYQVAYHTAARARAASLKRSSHPRETRDMHQADPLDEITWRELRGLLDEELHRLPDKLGSPLVLCYLQGKTQDEAARHLGWTKSTLRRRLEQGRHRLRLRLARRGVTLGSALAATLLTQAAAPAALPANLLHSTAQGAAQLSAGTASGVMPTQVAALTEGMLKTMVAARLKIVALVLLVVGGLALTAGLLARQTLAQPPAPAAAKMETGKQQPKVQPQPKGTPAPAPAPKPIRPADSSEMTITGKVLDADGKAATKARVAVLLWSHRRTQLGKPKPRLEVRVEGRTDAEGQFRLKVRRLTPLLYYQQRHYQMAVLAAAPGCGLGFHFVTLDAAKPEAPIRLPREQVRRGRLIDLQGQPVAGARIEVVQVGTPAPGYHYFAGADEDEAIHTYCGTLPFDANGGKIILWDKEIKLQEAPAVLAAWPGPATSDAQGRFTLRNLVADQPVGLHIRARDGVALQAVQLAARKEDRPPEATFSLAAAHVIEGTVTDARTGSPLLGARVEVLPGGGAGTPPWPAPADWKGRRGNLGQGYAPTALPTYSSPAVSSRTDAKGRFRVNPFLADRYTLLVTPPDGEPYLAVKQTVRWPRAAGKQTVDVALPRAVEVRGKVVEASSGQAVAQARVDFWSRAIPLPKDIFGELPDGIFYPRWLKTDARGEFRWIIPTGPCHVLVNGPGPDYVLKKIATADLGVKPPENPPAAFNSLGMRAGRREGKKHYYYPDEWKALNFKVGAKPETLRLTLHRAPLVKGRVVGPNDKPATAVRMWLGQEPFAELAHGYFARKYEVKDGRFELALRNPDAPLCVAFVDAKQGLGGSVALSRKEAGAEAVTVRLSPCGSATARFLDGKSKPLAGYRPLIWLSLPAEPYSSAAELENFGDPQRDNLDTVWVAIADPGHYGSGPKTDALGRVALPNLIPGVTYRIALFGGKEKTFKVEAGKTVKLDDLTVKDAAKTKDLPTVK